jgi:hypothetical protein
MGNMAFVKHFQQGMPFFLRHFIDDCQLSASSRAGMGPCRSVQWQEFMLKRIEAVTNMCYVPMVLFF